LEGKRPEPTGERKGRDGDDPAACVVAGARNCSRRDEDERDREAAEEHGEGASLHAPNVLLGQRAFALALVVAVALPLLVALQDLVGIDLALLLRGVHVFHRLIGHGLENA
jgi:hypothetical protein